jgi:hypothetical protein
MNERDRLISLALVQALGLLLSDAEEPARSSTNPSECSHPEEFEVDASSFSDPHRKFCKSCLMYFERQTTAA